MNLLFEQFDTLTEAPNGIQKLRELILQLAVQGKLVEQDPNDEPACELLKRIKVEKEKLSKEGKIKKEKQLPSISEGEIPYVLPEGWVWCRIKNICHNWGQKKPDNKFTYIDVASINNKNGTISDNIQLLASDEAPSRARKIVMKNTVIYSTVRPYLLNIAVIEKEYFPEPIASTAFAIVHPLGNIVSRYLFYCFRSSYFVDYVENQMIGMAYPAINDNKFFSGLVPIPPVDEQYRIVAKVDQLMALCDDLEKEKEKRNQKRIHVNNASLNKLLTANAPAEFQTHWQRIAKHFDMLYDVPENVAELKKAILQLAVMGKLVPQDPNDEPATDLLKQIKVEKEKLIKEGKIKKEKPLPPISEEEIPYELSEGWVWCGMADISNKIHYGYTASANQNIFKYKLLRITDIQNSNVNWNTVPGCEISDSEAGKYLLKENDILIARTGGTIGKSFLVPKIDISSVFASYLIRIDLSNIIHANYIKLFLGSSLYWDQLIQSSMGTGQPNVNGTALRKLSVPLPPLNEQKRIAAKVDQLIELCDELERKLEHSQHESERLMEAVVEKII